ncbi:hypothetical protein [Ammoniphilus sp. 3BR4]|uniref:hypothetical protein n=1 Tax=Ammoniphilus sp. 3BR4 TaxID=3158265 RepID=UPI003465F555
MYIKFKWSIAITIALYFFFAIISLAINKQIDGGFVAKWGFGFGLLLILTSLPLHKLFFYGSRPIAPNWAPPDEHLYRKLERDYNVENDERGKPYRVILIFAGLLSLGVAYLLHLLFV